MRLKYDTIRRNITRIPEEVDFMSYAQELKKFKELQKKFKPVSRWKNQEERIRYYMSIPPKKKLEWLREVQEFIGSVSARNQKFFLRKLREAR